MFCLDCLYAVSVKMCVQTLHNNSNKPLSIPTLGLHTDRWIRPSKMIDFPLVVLSGGMEGEFFFPFHSLALSQPLYSYRAVLVWGAEMLMLPWKP